MKRMLLAANCLALLGLGVVLTPATEAVPVRVTIDDTEDIIYLLDGRILHGQILDETYSTYLFKYVDRNLSLTTEMSIPKLDVVKIEHDVPVANAGGSAAETEDASAALEPGTRSTSAEYSVDAMKERYGATLATDAEGVPTFYIVPMKGQMGTDILTDIYEKVSEDIRRANPDVVVFVMECNETSEGFYVDGFEGPKPPTEWGLLEMDDYKRLVRLLRTDLKDVPQVMWVRDSEGISSMVAMAWDEIYMMPNARLGGLIALLRATGANLWPDVNVRAKMMAAFIGGAKSFLEVGGYDQDLAEAMLNPEHNLSGDWKGRTVDWTLDSNGEVVVDTSNRHTADFRAKSAEDYGISRGTAETFDDLAILLGYREYRIVEGSGEQIIDSYIENWRRAFKRSQDLYAEYQENASGGTIVDLGRARNALRGVQSLLKRFVAVERRWQYDFGIDLLTLQIMEEQLDEAIARASRNRGGAGRQSGGGGGSRLGAGGGGGGVIDD